MQDGEKDVYCTLRLTCCWSHLSLLLAKGAFSEEEKKLVSSAFGSIRKTPSSGPKKAKNEKEHLPRRSDDMGTELQPITWEISSLFMSGQLAIAVNSKRVGIWHKLSQHLKFKTLNRKGPTDKCIILHWVTVFLWLSQKFTCFPVHLMVEHSNHICKSKP